MSVPHIPQLTVHVLDMANGVSADGIKMILYKNNHVVTECFTAINGRTEQPLIGGADFSAHEYRLEFFLADYFRSKKLLRPDEKAFLEKAPIVFYADGASTYHIPLIITPWSYAVYRGS